VDVFLVATLSVDKKRRDEIDSTYTFRFVPSNGIPAGGVVVLTLPIDYNLIASSPPIKILTPNFVSQSAALPLSTSYTGNTVTVINIAEFPPRVEF
jgi:hypothetical protein